VSGPASEAGVPPPQDSAGPLVSLPAVDSRARYLERCSQFPVVGTAVGVGLLAAGIAGLAVAPSPSLADDVLPPVILIVALYLFVVVVGLPYGIEIATGRFAVGARSAAWPAGVLWQRITGPLEAVRCWDVLTPEEARLVRRRRRAELASGRQLKDLGDLRQFSRRRFLRLVVEPDSVEARFSSRPLRGRMFRKRRNGVGVVWDGAVVIGTRRPAALTAALNQALPGRRAQVIAQADHPET
jgi:hypothetical protein